MGVKRKVKHKDNVVELRREIGVVYRGDIYEMAERTGFKIDVLFHLLFTLCLGGLVLPTRLVEKDGELEIAWVMSKNAREAETIRELLKKGVDYCGGIRGDLEGTRDRIFGEIPRGRKKKG